MARPVQGIGCSRPRDVRVGTASRRAKQARCRSLNVDTRGRPVGAPVSSLPPETWRVTSPSSHGPDQNSQHHGSDHASRFEAAHSPHLNLRYIQIRHVNSCTYCIRATSRQLYRIARQRRLANRSDLKAVAYTSFCADAHGVSFLHLPSYLLASCVRCHRKHRRTSRR